MNIVLIAEAGGGKDFLAEYTIRKYGYTRYAFADHVKDVAKLWFPDSYGDDKEKPRWLLQAIGTKFREIDEDVWIKSMFQDIDEEAEIRKRCMEIPEYIIITDCRMPNEYQALSDRGFKFIRVNVREDIRKHRLLSRGDKFKEDDMKHHTESFYNQFECHYEMENNGTAEEAYEALDRIIEQIVVNEVTVEATT